MFHLEFLNKNTLRDYPLRGLVPVLASDGVALPTALFCSAQFSVIPGYEQVFISRIYINGNYINIAVATLVGAVMTYIGFFSDTVTEDYQSLKMTPLVNFGYGSLMIGRKDALADFQGYHTFTSDAGLIEGSLITCVPVPNLSSLVYGTTKLTGRVGFNYVNVREIANTTELQLEVINKELVKAINDQSATFGNCPTTAIGSMNGVTPDVTGNIDIYGITPVEIHFTSGGISITVPSINRDTLCATNQQIPPLVTRSNYLQNILTTQNPEWKSWPQYG